MEMTIRLFLSILGALGVLHGLAFVIVPGTVGTLYGLAASEPLTLMSRFFGGALIAWGGILWATKNFRDESAIRAVLQWTAVADAIGFLTAIASTMAGTLNASGWVPVAIYAFGTLGSVYFLVGQKRLVPA
jgi:hypothetical protein